MSWTGGWNLWGVEGWYRLVWTNCLGGGINLWTVGGGTVLLCEDLWIGKFCIWKWGGGGGWEVGILEYDEFLSMEGYDFMGGSCCWGRIKFPLSAITLGLISSGISMFLYSAYYSTLLKA